MKFTERYHLLLQQKIYCETKDAANNSKLPQSSMTKGEKNNIKLLISVLVDL